jgi:hypothetical protein
MRVGMRLREESSKESNLVTGRRQYSHELFERSERFTQFEVDLHSGKLLHVGGKRSITTCKPDVGRKSKDNERQHTDKGRTTSKRYSLDNSSTKPKLKIPNSVDTTQKYTAQNSFFQDGKLLRSRKRG